MTGTGIGFPETGKLPTAFVVSPPQSSRRSSVALIHCRLALGQSGPQPALVGGRVRGQARALLLQTAHELGREPVARGAAAGRAHEVAEPQRVRALGMCARLVAQLLR